MQQEPFAETWHEAGEFTYSDQGQHTMLLYQEMSAASEGSIYFGLPGQEDYLYEYEGDLEEALNALPEIYDALEARGELAQGEEQCLTLIPQAAVVIEQIWNYFDQTGVQELEGEHNYSFQVEADHLLVIPKDDSGRVVAISRDGQVESTFEPERYEHLMQGFAIAYEQIQMAEYQQNSDRDIEL